MGEEIMKNRNLHFTDEPTKIKELVMPIFASESVLRFELNNGASGRVMIGVAEQDDCAAFEVSGGAMIVAGSDYIRGAKFRLYEAGLLTAYDIGWYLAGANISDIAAMGAVPIGMLSVVRYPKDIEDEEFGEILRGIRDSCAAVDCLNVGGDIGTADELILSGSAFGMVEPEAMLLRSGAHAGQVICVTGATGGAGAAMKLVAAGARDRVAPEVFERLLAGWRRVSPRVAHGRLLAAARGATACIDTSDGLKAALETLAVQSQVGMVVDLESVPLAEDVRAAAEALEIDPWELVFGDSVDFELVATVEPDSFSGLLRRCTAQGLPLWPIGHTEDGDGVDVVSGGERSATPGESWRHR
ncbi:MAG: thiamine-phosphate kinase [Pseudarthrobacter sp.]